MEQSQVLSLPQRSEDIDMSSSDSVDNSPETTPTPSATNGGGGMHSSSSAATTLMPKSDTAGITKNKSKITTATNDSRRAKACNHCRLLKVRCIPSNPDDLSQPCVRCSKSKRECVFHVGPWKRSRRTDARVAALEKKLEVLTAALNGQQVSPDEVHEIITFTGATAETANDTKRDNINNNSSIDDIEAMSVISNTRVSSVGAAATAKSFRPTPLWRPVGSKSYGPRASLSSTPDSIRDYDSGTTQVRMKDVKEIREKMVSLWNTMSENSRLRLMDIAKQERMFSPTYETDVISQGLITVAEANERLTTYRANLFNKYTLIDVPENLTVEVMRRENPLLFLTIMAVTSVALKGHDHKRVCITIHNQAVDTLIYETTMLGRKNLEILKCLILLNMWYNTPETYQHQKNHLITHLCTTLAVDLGLGGTPFESQQSNSMKYDRLIRPDVLVNPRTAECRKLWLCVYISSVHVSMVIKRPIYLMWSRYTEECCEVLEQPDRSLMERRLAALARLNHLTEEITRVLQGMDSQAPPDLNDPLTQYIIKEFEIKLKALEDRADMGSQLFQTALHFVQIFLHEFAMYVPVSERLGRAPFSEFSLAMGTMRLSTHTAQAIGWCYSSAIKCLEIIASQTVEEIAIMPLFCYMRMTFSASTLLKLRTLYLTTPDFHQVCTVKSASLEPINQLIDKLDQVIAEHPFANLAVNFCFVLHVLICHFDRQLHYFYNPNDQYQKEGQTVNTTFSTKNSRYGDSTPINDYSSNITNKIDNNSINHTKNGSINTKLPPVSNSTYNTPGSSSGINVEISPQIFNGKDNIPNIPRSEAVERRYSELRGSNSMTDKLEFLSAIATSPLPSLTTPHGGDFRNDNEADFLPRPSQLPQYEGIKADQVESVNSTQNMRDYPSWLITDDFWKDLVPSVEALTGFDMF